MAQTAHHDLPVVVVGCGIIGLTSAIRLVEAGFDVRIVARDLPPSTTSNKAAAIWDPYKAEPADKVAAWAEASYRTYGEQLDDPAYGLSRVELRQISRIPISDPEWLRPAYPFRRLAAEELPESYVDGYATTVPMIPSAGYLDELMRRFAALGGDIEIRRLECFSQIRGARAIVNCTGLGARRLAGDPDVKAIRGQLVVVSNDCDLDQYVIDEATFDQPTYIFPRGHEIILGGSADHDDWRTHEDPVLRAQILERCRALIPELEGCTFLRPIVGLRPGRSQVRIEAEAPTPTTPLIVHNYGHGGAGFTIAWGCATDVVDLVSRHAGLASKSRSEPKTRL